MQSNAILDADADADAEAISDATYYLLLFGLLL
jgi:hypothetical protein